jgi:cytochrome c5
MRPSTPFGVLAIVLAASFAPPRADAATVSGTVKGPDGTPFRGAFVQARHAGLKMTVSVLTDNQGRYFAENLPEGDYRIGVRSIGYRADVRAGVKLGADQNASFDFALTAVPVRWSDLTIAQGAALLPEARGKKTLMENCMSCHGFQSRMAATIRDEDGWRDRVSFMREAMRSSLADRQGFSDQQAEDVISYLSTMFGENSPLPKSPADLPGYKATLNQFSDEALKIVYVDFEMPGPNRFPNTARPIRSPG